MRLRDEKKHEAICNAAVGLITEIGFEATSISKIAERARVSPATIYIYFNNKEELLNEVYLKVKKEMSAAMVEGLSDKFPVEKAFSLVWHNFYTYARESPVDFAFAEQFASSPLVHRVNKDEGLAYYDRLIRLFERGRSERVFKDIPLAVFYAVAFFPVIGLLRQSYGENLVFGEKTIETVYEIAWRAVARERIEE